jgi:ABC-type branched-chain amino acid transport systems, ATPase component
LGDVGHPGASFSMVRTSPGFLPMRSSSNRRLPRPPKVGAYSLRMTVEENLMLGAMTADPHNYDRNRDEVFELFPRLKERRSQRGGTLSGGEQQMLAIGRALMSEPRLLILDEPSLGLAPMIVRQIFEIIAKVNKERGLTVFMVEQNANQALKLAHRAHVLVTGEITLSGTGAELRANEEVRAAYLEGH